MLANLWSVNDEYIEFWRDAEKVLTTIDPADGLRYVKKV
jgi:hypothetical protein